MKIGQAVFARMQTIYGRQWPASIGGDAKAYQAAIAQWDRALARYDTATIGAAIERAQSAYIDYPPTLPQFLSLCRTPAAHRELPRALPKPRDKAKAAAAIKDIKSKLRINQ